MFSPLLAMPLISKQQVIPKTPAKIQPTHIAAAQTRLDWRLRKTRELNVCTAIVTVKYAVAQLPI
jgi:hypothetical protein